MLISNLGPVTEVSSVSANMSSIEMDDPSQVDVAMKTVMHIRYTAGESNVLNGPNSC